MQSFDGDVFERGDEGYPAAWSTAIRNERKPDRYPEIIVRARTEADVVNAVALARERGLKVKARGGGHSFTASHVRDGGLLIDFRDLREITIDPEGLTATVTPSVTSRELTEALAEHDLTFPSGHCPTVGLGGFLLQGGFGWNGCTWGPACASVRAIDVVTARGELVHSDDESNPELIWAARGSGPGFFGVVTRYHLRVYRRPQAMHVSRHTYSFAQRQEVLRWLLEMTPELPRELEVFAIVGGARSAGAPLSGGGPGIVVRGVAHVDTAEEAHRLLSMLETCPVLDQAVATTPPTPTSLSELYEEADRSVPECRYAVDCMWVDTDPALIPAVEELLATIPTPQSHIDFMCWREQPVPNGVFSMQSPLFISVYTQWEDEADDERCVAWPAEQMRRLEPLSVGIQLADENLIDRPWPFLAPAELRRLEQLRRKHDPDGLFHSYLMADGVAVEDGHLVTRV